MHRVIKIAGSSETMISSREGIWRRIQEDRDLRSTSHVKRFRSIQVFLLDVITDRLVQLRGRGRFTL